MTLEEQAKQWADEQAPKYSAGEGFFFDFSHIPELKKPIITYFCDTLQWTLDYDNTFLRKPDLVKRTKQYCMFNQSDFKN